MTKQLIDVRPDTVWLESHGYKLLTMAIDQGKIGEVWRKNSDLASEKVSTDLLIVSRMSGWTTVYLPLTNELRLFPTTNIRMSGYEWTSWGVNNAIRAAFTQFPQWGTTFVVTTNQEDDKWAVVWHKSGEPYTAYLTKEAVTNGDLAWIAAQFAKSPRYLSY